jgi:hypothetical protein
MLEQSLQQLFEELAAADQPPAKINISQAIRQGRVRLRRRRLGAACTPLLAAGAVVAVALSGAIPAGPRTPTATSPATAQAPWPKGRPLNPLVPFASFGWLPAGKWSRVGEANEKEVQLRAYQITKGSSFSYWILDVYPPHQCTLTHKHLDCEYAGGAATDQAPDINGRSAYWITGGAYSIRLAFNYAPGGWAFLGHANPPVNEIDRTQAVKIAQHISLGTTEPIRFGAQLVRMPTTWHVYDAYYAVAGTRLEATQYLVAPITKNKATGEWQYPLDTPAVTLLPANARTPCINISGGTRYVIDGYRVRVLDEGAGQRSPEWHLCAADADGLHVDIYESGRHPALSVVQLFTRLKLLGRNPSHWTTRPVR